MAEPPRLAVTDLTVTYRDRQRRALRAVDGVSLTVARGETLGIVGESGCGKSSLARRVVGLAGEGGGTVLYDGQRIDSLDAAAWKPLRRRIQYVFQDPLGALDPRMSVRAQVAEPLTIHGLGDRAAQRAKAEALLADVGIAPHLFEAAPSALSGGQRQRVVLARALVLEPELLLCDEPVSALDVSIQAQILCLLEDLRARHALTMLFISHDLAVVRHVSHRVGVMYLGRIVETGAVDDIFARPAHPYTRALLDAAPRSGGRASRLRLEGETPSAADRPRGCAFAARCPARRARCLEDDPALTAQNGRAVACHFPYALEAAA
ncbi:MAG: oligopeptide/dipeptide ABC transporter ATP-binding protein [Pseudomonadota bacterium]